ncbi:helix-turn-helix domain-containing protein [Rhizobium sp. A22-96]
MKCLRAVDPRHIKNSDGLVIFQKQVMWNGARADVVHRTALQRQEIKLAADKHLIFLNIRGAATLGEDFIDGRRVGFVARPEGSLTYLPPGCQWRGWDEGDNSAAYLLISIEEDFASRIFDKSPRLQSLHPELAFKDLQMQFTARRIAHEMGHCETGSGLVIEGYLTAILGHLQRRSGVNGKACRGGLTPYVLRRTIERIDVSISEPISILQLAEDAGVSLAHFCRAFKKSTGSSPYAFFNRRRVERASEFLRTTTMSITEIAFACGYSSASHLSTSFRQEIGVPPIEYRATWLD